MLAPPIPRQQVVDPLRGVILQTRQDIGEPSLWVDVVELGGLDQRVDCGGALAAYIGACEGPVVTAECDSTERTLGAIVGHAQAAVVEKAGEDVPALEAVVDRLEPLRPSTST